MRQIRHFEQQVLKARLDRSELLFERLQLLRESRAFGHQRRDVLTFCLQQTNLFRQFITPLLQLLGFHLHRFAFGFQCVETVDVELVRSRCQTRRHSADVFA